MRLERVTNAGHPMYQKALALYGECFPFHEQREALSQENIVSDPDYHFNLVYGGDLFVGLLLCWEAESFIYVEHLCIAPGLRNRNYGQKALELLKCRNKNIILEIDPPIDALSIRRKGFYERCGFAENPYPHIHPPYHAGMKGHALVVMSSPAPITAEEYDLFHHYLKRRVMADAYSPSPA